MKLLISQKTFCIQNPSKIKLELVFLKTRTYGLTITQAALVLVLISVEVLGTSIAQASNSVM